jgi:hypothetical protein
VGSPIIGCHVSDQGYIQKSSTLSSNREDNIFSEKVFNMPNGKSSDGLRRVFIHCGSYKTGSSSIQNDLYKNRNELVSNGVLFPKTGLMLDKPEIGQRHWHFVYKFNQKEFWDSIFDKLIREISASKCHTVILSAEAWSRVSALDSLQELTERLKILGFDVFGIMYLRNRYDYGRALYREVIRRWGSKFTFEQYISQKFNKNTISLTKLVSGFKDIFEDKAIFRDYAEIEDVLKDFNQIVGINSIGDISVNCLRQNTGWSAVDAELQRFKNVGFDENLISKAALNIPTWIRESVAEQYPVGFFGDADDSFELHTGFSSQQTHKILYVDKLSSMHDIKPLSELIKCLLDKRLGPE